MKKIVLLINSLISLTIAIAQKQTNDDLRTVPVYTLTFLEPGAGIELPLGKQSTAKLRAGITATLGVNEFENDLKFFPRPMGSLSFRYYYNFAKRDDNGLNTDFNSANYVAILGMYAAETFRKDVLLARYDITSSLLNAGVVWGLQRNYKKRFSLDLNVGAGFVSNGDVTGYSIIGEFTLGIWLNKRSN
jgi:hypothetical protein